MKRTQDVNRGLLGSPVTRPLYLAMRVPNGIIVGCEAPFAGQSGAGYLFAAAAGMLVGDVVVGRFVAARHRDRMITPLQLLPALPYPGFWPAPSPSVAVVLAFVASGRLRRRAAAAGEAGREHRARRYAGRRSASTRPG
ncbi:hypothetical protein [Actinoplanes xinjiangensis]|uniref:hypothetical protein n=1 Tax=Actinoplanes xinjiangensis TaxID=512350 RepID=UPI0034417A85